MRRPLEREGAGEVGTPSRRKREHEQKYVMISVVSERFDIHPQTLRLYEREGLINPARSAGNTRLYDVETLERIEQILTLTRDLGVNLAGVEVILELQEQMDQMHAEVNRLLAFVKQEVLDQRAGVDRRHALVRVSSGLPAAVTKR
jgi:MerR family transcriptional regulator/heat shock protein HspR